MQADFLIWNCAHPPGISYLIGVDQLVSQVPQRGGDAPWISSTWPTCRSGGDARIRKMVNWPALAQQRCNPGKADSQARRGAARFCL